MTKARGIGRGNHKSFRGTPRTTEITVLGQKANNTLVEEAYREEAARIGKERADESRLCELNMGAADKGMLGEIDIFGEDFHSADLPEKTTTALAVATPKDTTFRFDPNEANPYELDSPMWKQWRIRELELEMVRIDEEDHKVQQKIREFEENNKFLYFGRPDKQYLGKYGKWGPNSAQAEFLKRFREGIDQYRIFTYTGGNQIGKTTLCTGIMALTFTLGHFPWEDPKTTEAWIWKAKGWKPPIMVRIVGQDWEKHIKGVVIPAIKEVFPESFGFTVKKNNIGVEATIIHPTNGSTVEIMSNNSEPSVFEGAVLHALIYDEPSTRDIRVACARGLIANNGIELFAMTLLKEAWVDKEVINLTDADGNPDLSVCNVHADIYVNVGHGLNLDGIEQFSKLLTDDEKQARIHGIPSYRSKVILNIDRDKHLIKEFPVPTDWLVDVAIDIGVSKPHDITYLATSGRNFKYLIFSETVRGDGYAIADSIVRYSARYSLRVNRIIIDPLAKGDKNNENSTFEKCEIQLARHGYRLEVGSKDKEDGILAINELLHTIHGEPAFFIFTTATAKGIRQLQNWMRDDDGKPLKEDDDVCENLYRLFLLKTSYYPPEDEEDEFYRPLSTVNTTRNPVTGY